MDEHNWLGHTELLIGKDNVEKLKNAHVLVAGLGGVGSFAAEAICRAGVGSMTIVDNDVVMKSNRNRQLPALKSTEGKSKVAVMSDRLMDINPDLDLKTIEVYLKDEVMGDLLHWPFEYVVDAIDTLTPKVFFIKHCMDKGLHLVSSMGAGGRLDPSKIQVEDIADSHNCPFARLTRKKLHGFGIRSGFKVVFSTEPVIERSVIVTDSSPNKKSTVGTISYLPAIFGLTAASVVIRDIIDSSSS